METRLGSRLLGVLAGLIVGVATLAPTQPARAAYPERSVTVVCASGAGGRSQFAADKRGRYEVHPTGNAMNLEDEMIKVAFHEPWWRSSKLIRVNQDGSKLVVDAAELAAKLLLQFLEGLGVALGLRFGDLALQEQFPFGALRLVERGVGGGDESVLVDVGGARQRGGAERRRHAQRSRAVEQRQLEVLDPAPDALRELVCALQPGLG